MDLKLDINLPAAESDFLKSFALSKYEKSGYFRTNGKSRWFCLLNNLNIPEKEIAVRLWKYVYNKLEFDHFEEEPRYGIFLGINTEGGFVHEHTDPSPRGKYHVRVNFLLSKPEAGGMPIVDGKTYYIEENECWLNIANIWPHTSTPVIGTTPRVVLSFGALISAQEIENKNWNKYKKLA